MHTTCYVAIQKLPPNRAMSDMSYFQLKIAPKKRCQPNVSLWFIERPFRPEQHGILERMPVYIYLFLQRGSVKRKAIFSLCQLSRVVSHPTSPERRSQNLPRVKRGVVHQKGVHLATFLGDLECLRRRRHGDVCARK